MSGYNGLIMFSLVEIGKINTKVFVMDIVLIDLLLTV